MIMKILQFMPEFAIAGAETMCENLSTELARKGHKVTIVSLYTYESAITKRLKERGIQIVFLDKKLGFDRSMLGKIRSLIKRTKPDVIHTHRYTAQYAILASLGLNVKARIHTVHNVAQKENTHLARRVNNFFFHCCGLVPVALTQLIKKSIIEEYKLEETKIPVIYNGIPLENCKRKTSYEIGETINILHIGRYSEQKNHTEMIKAIVLLHSKYPNIKLHLWGDGILRKTISDSISNYYATDYIIEYGLCDAPYQHLKEADIFLLPSKYEGMPMTIIEAMGTALPIVASNVGGMPDIVEDQKNGLLCSPVAEDIAEKVETLILNQDLREKLGRNAIVRANDFTSQKMTEQYVNLYRERIER